MTTTDRMISAGGAVKALAEGVIEGYLARFTNRADKDKHGEYFDTRTDFGLQKGYAVENAFNLYHHGMGELGALKIGKFIGAVLDEHGIKATAQLDMGNPAVPPLFARASRGELFWSSGALPQSVQVEPDGHIKRWYIIEGSLTPDPAEPDGTNVRTIKAAMLDEPAQDPTGTGETVTAPLDVQLPSDTKESDMDILKVVTAVIRKLGADMTGEEIAALIEEISAAASGEVAVLEEATPEEAMMAAPPEQLMKAAEHITGLVTARVNAIKSAKAAGLLIEKASTVSAKDQLNQLAGGFSANPVGMGGANPSKSAGSLAHIEHLRLKSRMANIGADKLAYALMLDNHLSALGGTTRIHFAGIQGDHATGRNVAKMTMAAHAIEAAEKGEFELDDVQHVKAFDMRERFTKANELDNTAAAGFGEEWVNDTWSQQLWFRARRENVVASRIPSFQMTSQVQYDPTESSDGTVYLVTEATDATQFSAPTSNSARIGTNKQTFDVANKKLQRKVLYSLEELEDSIIKFDSQMEAQARRNMLDAIDYVILNGDTETGTTNINYDDGSPTATDRYLIFDGILKYALANNAVNMNSLAPTYDKIVETLYTLNDEIVGDTADTLWFVQPAVQGRLIRIDEYVTANVVGSTGANLTGRVGNLAGVDLFLSQQILKSAVNGKVNDTAGVNLYGRMAAVYLKYWKLGYRRNVDSYMSRAADGQSYMLTLTARLDLKQHTDGNGWALLYNIAI